MPAPLLFSIIESPNHPDFSKAYEALGIENICLSSQRKAISQLKKTPPDWVVAEFFYGYGNNYAGVNISNLDVFLHSLRKYAPNAKVIVLTSKTDLPHCAKLVKLFPIHRVLPYPITRASFAEAFGFGNDTE